MVLVIRMGNMELLTTTIKNNKNLNAIEKELIVDFIGDLIYLKYDGIDLNNLIYNLKDLKISNSDNKAGYNPLDNTIYLDQNSVQRWQYNMYRALLNCSITNRNGSIIKQGIIDESGNNFALKEAITQRFLDLMLGNSENNPLDIEMNIYSKIQEIVGLDKILFSYFKADNSLLNEELYKYNIDPSILLPKIDRIMNLNFNNIESKYDDNRIVCDVERLLMNGYATKISNYNDSNLNIDNFRNNIITSGTIQAYSKDTYTIFEGVSKNSEYFDMLINGVELSKNNISSRAM